MPIKYDEGTLRVSFGYGLKLNRGDYNSEDVHMSTSLEFSIEGDPVAVLEEAVALESKLAQHTKLAVFAELGLDGFTEIKEGVVGPKIPKVADTPKAKRTYGAPKGGGGGRGGAGGGQYGKPKAATADLPRITLFGTEYFDQRGLKEDGTYKPGAADFRSVTDRSDQLWLQNRDGDWNDDVVGAVEAAEG